MDKNQFSALVGQLRADLATEVYQVSQTCHRALEGLRQDYDERLQALAQYAYGVNADPQGVKLKSCVLPDGRSAHIIRETSEFIDVVAGDSLERWPLEKHSHMADTRVGTRMVTDMRQPTSESDLENEAALPPQPGDEVELPDGTIAEVVSADEDGVFVRLPDDDHIQVSYSDLELENPFEPIKADLQPPAPPLPPGSQPSEDIPGQQSDSRIAKVPQNVLGSPSNYPLEVDVEYVLKNGNHINVVEIHNGVALVEYDDGTRARTRLETLLQEIDHEAGDEELEEFDEEDLAEEGEEEYYPGTGIAPPKPAFPLEQQTSSVKIQSPISTGPPQVPSRPVVAAPTPAAAPSPRLTGADPLPSGLSQQQLSAVQQAAKLNGGPFQMSALPRFIEQLRGTTTDAASWTPVVQHLVDIGGLDFYEDKDGGQWFQSPDCTIPIDDAVWGIVQRQAQAASTQSSRKQEREQISASKRRGAASRRSTNAVPHKRR